MSDDRTSAELEREAERRRAEVNRTAEELRGRLTPGQIVDEVAGYLNRSDSALAWHNLGTQVRENPLALALIGGGLAWLFAGPGARETVSSRWSHSRSLSEPTSDHRFGGSNASNGNGHSSGTHFGDTMRNAGRSLSGTAHGAASGMGSSARDAGRSVGGAMSSAASGMGSSARDAGRSVSGAMSSAAAGLSESAGNIGDSLSEGWDRTSSAMSDFSSSAGEHGRHYAYAARDSFSDLLEREPLIVGAIGVAVGAAIGAMMPTTRIEEEYAGEAAEHLRSEAGHYAEQAWEKAESAISKTAEAVTEAARSEGLTTSELAAKAERVAKAATDAAKDEVGGSRAKS